MIRMCGSKVNNTIYPSDSNDYKKEEPSGGGVHYKDPEKLKVHSYNLDVMPKLSEEKFEALKEDIGANGIRDPIDLSPDGEILDGRHRRDVADELGMEEVPCIVHNDLETENEQRLWIINANFLGRDWDTKSKYLVIAEQSFNLEVGRGGDRRSEKFQKSQSGMSENSDVLEKTSEKLGVSTNTVWRARKYYEVMQEAPCLDRIDSVSDILNLYDDFKEIKETAYGSYPEWIGNLASYACDGTDFVQIAKMAKENPKSMNRFYKEMKSRKKKIEQKREHERKRKKRKAEKKSIFDEFDFSSLNPIFAVIDQKKGKGPNTGTVITSSVEEPPVNQLLCGDSREVLKDFPKNSVHLVQFSPWYWKQRGQKLDGEIGSEDSLDEYINNLAELCSEIKRVLRPDGSMWVVIGDVWREKCQQLVPERLALTLQKDGWILRNKIIWAKKVLNQEDMTTVGKAMPGPWGDRFLYHHESILFLTPEPDYYFDQRPALTELKKSSERRHESKTNKFGGNPDVEGAKLAKEAYRGSNTGYVDLDASGAKPGDVWRVRTAQRHEKHYSAYSKEICDMPIKVACPERVCSDCGAPYNVDYKLVSREPLGEWCRQGQGTDVQDRPGAYKYHYERVGYTTPACQCGADYESGIVLDPMMGTGSTLVKAKELGRRYIGIDLDGEAVEMAERRLENET